MSTLKINWYLNQIKFGVNQEEAVKNLYQLCSGSSNIVIIDITDLIDERIEALYIDRETYNKLIDPQYIIQLYIGPGKHHGVHKIGGNFWVPNIFIENDIMSGVYGQFYKGLPYIGVGENGSTIKSTTIMMHGIDNSEWGDPNLNENFPVKLVLEEAPM